MGRAVDRGTSEGAPIARARPELWTPRMSACSPLESRSDHPLSVRGRQLPPRGVEPLDCYPIWRFASRAHLDIHRLPSISNLPVPVRCCPFTRRTTVRLARD